MKTMQAGSPLKRRHDALEEMGMLDSHSSVFSESNDSTFFPDSPISQELEDAADHGKALASLLPAEQDGDGMLAEQLLDDIALHDRLDGV